MGEIVMVTVDPSYQRQGLATALTEAATDWLRDRGAIAVMVETGGATPATSRPARPTRAPALRPYR
jgi:GNAT superfamily N-acetyltransferase